MDKLQNLLEIDEYINYKKINHTPLDEIKYKQMIEEHNRNFIKNKLIEYQDYFDHLYDDINPYVKLDINQRIAILTNEDYNLIIAGAGSGKTTTMIGKIKYLIEKCHVDSSEILAISFARKNVEELDQKLNKQLHLNVDTKTFHQLGLSIINEYNPSRVQIISDGLKYKIFLSYFETILFQNPIDLKNMTLFLTCYYHVGSEMDSFSSLNDYHQYMSNSLSKSLKDKYEDYNQQVIDKRQQYRRTIHSEYVRSNEELKIANFLFLNGLEYEYEKRYVYSKKDDRVYRPDFTIMQGENTIYLEHFGIHENGTSHYYSVSELNKYNHNIVIKEQIHARNGTRLIKTYSSYNDNRTLLSHLTEKLIENGFVLTKKTDEEVFSMLRETSKDQYFYLYITLAMDFISKFKLNKHTMQDFDKFIMQADNDRTKLFLITVKPLLDYYEKYLFEHSMIDFEDMIMKANSILESNYKPNKSYQYLIIDEYQDISKQRFDLIKDLASCFSSYIIAVGDDWQSIFGFAGSDVSLFTHFEEVLGYGEILKIVNTYRNAQELIDVAGEFVQKDDNNIKKTLISNKHINKPVAIYSYDDSIIDYIEKAKAVSIAISEIYEEYPNKNILLIGRYNHDLVKLLQSDLFVQENDKIICNSCKEVDISFTTVHKSKGLEYDNVIIINAIDHTYGFPSKVKDDPIFTIFNDHEENFGYAEERRLFYVALTRTKNKVYIIVPQSKPSPFVIELKKNIHVEFKDNVIDQYENLIDALKCPKCGQKLLKSFFKELNQYVYVCSNDDEICHFMTTELHYKIPIRPCPKCNGYLLYKGIAKNNSIMVGCSNYSEDHSGCNYMEFIAQKEDNRIILKTKITFKPLTEHLRQILISFKNKK